MWVFFVGNKAKGRISKRKFQENKARQIFSKTNISYPLMHTRTCAYQGVRNVCFFGKFGVLFFLKHLFWDLPFCVITDDFCRRSFNDYQLTLSWRRRYHIGTSPLIRSANQWAGFYMITASVMKGLKYIFQMTRRVTTQSGIIREVLIKNLKIAHFVDYVLFAMKSVVN